jgi:hypothetical protein
LVFGTSPRAHAIERVPEPFDSADLISKASDLSAISMAWSPLRVHDDGQLGFSV